jgi:hypothetical protein
MNEVKEHGMASDGKDTDVVRTVNPRIAKLVRQACGSANMCYNLQQIRIAAGYYAGTDGKCLIMAKDPHAEDEAHKHLSMLIDPETLKTIIATVNPNKKVPCKDVKVSIRPDGGTAIRVSVKSDKMEVIRTVSGEERFPAVEKCLPPENPDAMKVTFNVVSLEKIIKAMKDNDSEMVQFEIGKPLDAIRLKAVGGKWDVSGVVMPCRER